MVLWVCSAFSGAAALALEMLWMRSAGLLIGQTAATAATVLSCYFAGLGLGALTGRTIGSDAARTYGRLEIGVGLGVLWSLIVFRAAGALVGDGWLALQPFGGFLCVGLATLPATICLGATLPALGHAVERAGSAGTRAALLYALNTLGGVLGVAAAGFGMPAWIGVSASYAVIAATSLTVGSVALIAARHAPTVSLVASPSGTVMQVPHGRLRAVALGAGALALGLEVLWTRLFAQVLHNSVYSFAAIVLVYVLAIAIGAAIGGLGLRRRTPAALAGGALLGAAVACVGGLWLFVVLTDGLAYVGMHSGLGEYLLRIVGLAALSAGPAALCSGIVLPALWAAWGRAATAAQPLGELAAANTAGGVVGALLMGFVAIPNFGVRAALLGVALTYVGLAVALAPRSGRWFVTPLAALVLIAAADPLRAPLVNLREGETLRALHEGTVGVVSVVETSDDLQLRLDNFYILGGRAAATNERRLGLLPLLLHSEPHRALFVGLATGISASAGPAMDLDETTVVELVSDVAAAARTHFAPWNGGLLERHDVRLIVDDGRHWLSATDERFDVIVSDLFIPWHAGAGSLYAREMDAAAAAHLTPDGLFCQWLPLYQLTREDFDLIARTLLTVFPVVTLWRADFYPDRPVVGLVGQQWPHPVDLAGLRERLQRLPDWARDPLLATPRGLALLYAGDLSSAPDLLPGETINTDDRPLLEFSAPRLTRINARGDKDWFTGEPLAAFVDALASRNAVVADPLRLSSEDMLAARAAGRLLYRYALAAQHQDETTARDLERAVERLVPEVVAGDESTGAVDRLADARRTLAELQQEQVQVRQQLEAMEQRLGALTQAQKDVE